MAKKDELAVGVRVSLEADDEKTYLGNVARLVPGGKCEVKFDDGDLSILGYGDLTVVVPETNKDVPEPEQSDNENEQADEDEESITITKTITISKSDVTLDSHTMSDPKRLEREEAKQAELAKRRRKTRLTKLKAKPKTPIQVRKDILAARLRKVKARKPHNYRKEQLIAWTKEYELIRTRPGSWKPGCIRAKKKKTAQDFIDELQIDD